MTAMAATSDGPIVTGASVIARALGMHPQSVRRLFRDRRLPGAFKVNDAPNSPIKISRENLARIKKPED
jgi:hypothetical protein